MKNELPSTSESRAASKVVLIDFALRKAEHARWLEDVRRNFQQVLDAVELPEASTTALDLADDRDLSDVNVVKNERAFRRRFGPGFNWRRLHRTALIQLKAEKDLTDFELQALHWSGSLKRTLAGVEIAAHWSVALSGALLCCYVSTIFLVILKLKWPYGIGPLEASIRASLGLVFISILGWAHYSLYVHPWRIQHRIKRQELLSKLGH